MTEKIGLTLPGVRGCGSRESGGVYASLGQDPGGMPVWDYLIDPAIPWQSGAFQGIQPAPLEVASLWAEDTVLLVDWCGAGFYKSAPSFVEEVRRRGLSRRINPGFDFAGLSMKRVFLAMIHPKVIMDWQTPDLNMEFPRSKYCQYCQGTPQEATEHLPDCLYHLWPLALQLYSKKEKSSAFGPLVIKTADFTWQPFGLLEVPQVGYDLAEQSVVLSPGFFAAFPITHFECVDYVPEGADVRSASLPVIVCQE